MEDANLPPAGPVNDISSIDALETTGTQVSGASYASSKEYPLDDLEVHQPGARVTAESFSQHTPKLVPLSRRRALVVSVIITVIVVLLTGASGVFFLRNDDPLPTNSSLTGVPSQDVQIEKATQSVAASELQGTKEALLVNGNVITRGDLQLVTGGFTTILRPETITANQTYLLPNASGTLCLNTNNCNFASVIQLQQLSNQLGQLGRPASPVDDVDVTLLNNQSGAISIQGASNQVSVSTSNGVISLNTPQDIAPISSPTFASLLLTNNFTVNGVIDTTLNCTGFANNGALTTNASGQLICSDDDGGASGVSTPGGTSGVLAMFSAGQTIADSIISQSLGTATVSGALSVTGSISANSLSLSTALSVANGGTGAASFTSNGVLLGNGASPVSATSAPAAGQVLIGNAGGVPTFTSLSGDVLVSSGGVTTVQANSVALSVDTTGNYVASLLAGSGISVGAAGEGSTPTVALSALTADWNQTGAFDIVLNNANSELRVLESAGGVFYGSIDVDDLTADRTYTLPDNSGTVCLDSGNCVGGAGGAPNSASYLTVANNATLTGERAIATGTNLSAVDGGADGSYTFSVVNNPSFSGLVSANGGISLGTQTLQGTTGVIDFSNFDVDGSGNVSANALTLATALGVGSGGTGRTSLTSNGILLGNGAGGVNATLAPTSGQLLVGSAGGVPTFVSASGDISISAAGLTSIQADSVALGTDTTGNYVASLSAGNGISVSAAGEGINAAVGLSALTANWNQTGAFDLVLNNASSELRVLESVGGTFFGTLDVDDLSADRTYTLPDSSGTVCLDSGNCVGGAGGAPNSAAYLTIGSNATLTGERAITAGTNLSATDAGANSTYTLNVVNNPTFSGLITAGAGIDLGGQTLQGTTAIIDFNNFDVDASGNITNPGTINGQTISNNANFAGNLTVSSILQVNGNSLLGNSAADTITLAGTIQGSTPFVLEGLTPDAHQISIAVADPSADRTYTIPFVSGNADFCLSTGNCAGSGGGVTTSGGTTNRVAKFTGSQSLGDSTITDNGTDVSVSGNFTLQGGSLTAGSITQTGTLALHDGNGETVTFAVPNVTSSYILTLPSAVGAANQCLKAQNGSGTLFWDTCLGGGGGGGGISTINGESGPSITFNNASAASNVVTIDNAAADGTTKGVAAFNATNFTASSGVVNTAQNINTGAAPTFAGLSLTGNLQLNANTIQGTTTIIDFSNFDVAGNGNTTIGGTLNVTGAASLNGGAVIRGLTVDTVTATDDRIVTSVTAGGAARFDGTITNADLTAARMWTLPDATGTVITTGNLTAITATGTITSGTWQGSSINDTYIDDTLTISSGGTVDWSALNNYPAACGAGQAITQLGDSVTCSTFAAGSGSGNYIQNQNASSQTVANYWVSGSGRSDTSMLTPLLDTASGVTLNVGTSTASGVSISKSGSTSTVNGALTVTEATTLNAGVTASGGTISLTGSGASSFTSTATLTLQATSGLSVSTANNAGGNTAGVTISTGNAGAGTAGAVSIDTGTSTSGTPAIFFGTNNARSVNVGNTTAATTTTINGGTGSAAISLQAGSSGTVIIGTTNSNSITIGNSSGSVALNGDATVAANFTVTNAGNVAFQRGADFSTTGSSDNVNFGTGALFRLTGLSAQAITGIAGGVDGRMITLVNAASQSATLNNNSGSSSVGNRIITGTGSDLTLEAGASTALTYDSTATVWRVVGGVASTAAIGANAALSNLSSVAINTSLLTGADNTIDLGSSAFSWRSLYADTSVLSPLLDTASAVALNIGTTNATAINLNQNTTISTAKTLTVTSGATTLTGATTGDALTVSNSTSTGNIAVFKDNATAVFTIGDGGTVISDGTGTQAFRIRNSTSNDIFTVDATNRKVAIGTNPSPSSILGQLQVIPITSGRIGVNVQAYDNTQTAALVNLVGFSGQSGEYIAAYNENGSQVAPNIFSVQYNGTVNIGGGQLRTFNQSGASTNSAAFAVNSGDVNGATSNSGSISLRSGGSSTSGNTGTVTLQSGNAAGGNSGNILIDAGTASGTVGTISLGASNASAVALSRSGVTTTVNGALAVTEAITASSTYNTNTFTSTALTFGGAGATTIAAANNQNLALQATGTGALTLSSGSGVITASNDITFATGGARTLSVAVQTTSNTAGNALTVQSATGNGSGAGGALTVRAGTAGATGSGGDLNLLGGAGGSTSGSGGDIFVTAGAGTTSGTGGKIVITGGAGSGGSNGFVRVTTASAASGNFAGGNLDLLTGNGFGTASGGPISISAGNGGATGVGGTVSISSGTGGGSSAGGAITLQAGQGGSTGAGGNVTLQGGTSGTGATGNGGTFTINGGNAASTNGTGGDIVLTPGTKTGSGTSGGVLIQPAASNDAVNTFALKNSSGTTILRVGSADQTVLPNLATNGSAEQNSTNWVARSGTTMARTNTFANTGSYSISAATNAVDEGVNYSLPSLANGTYIFTAYVRGTVSSTVELGYSADGVTHTSCGASESYTTGGWRIVKCGSFVATGWNASAFIYVRVNAATNQTIYIDGLQLASGTNVPSFANGTLQVDGMITSRLNLMTAEDSESAFSIQSSNGNGVFSVNTESPAVGIGLDQPNAMLHISRLARDDLLRVSAAGVDLFNVFEDGTNTRVSFISRNNNTTAFRVMNASSNSALTVDTQNNQVIIDAATQYTQRLCHSGADGAAQNNITLGDCNAAGQADLAEMYETVGTTEPGDVVVTKGAYSVGRSDSPYQAGAIGIVSTNPVADGIIGNNVTSATRQPIALAGRVPVKVSLENGPINKGDYLTASSTPGFAMKATATGRVIGMALEDYTGTEPRVSSLVTTEEVARDTAHAGVLSSYRSNPASWPTDTAKIMVFVNATYYVPPITDVLQGTDMSLTGNAIINGNATVGSNLNVSGATTLASLTVTGSAVVQGSLQVVGDITTQNITVNGHFITSGNAPQVVVGAGAGVANLQQNITSPIVTVEGNDTSGTITIVAGANAAADELTRLTFATQFASKPRVVLTAANRDSAKLGAYYDAAAASQSSFSIMSDQAPEAGKSYVFTYFIVQ